MGISVWPFPVTDGLVTPESESRVPDLAGSGNMTLGEPDKRGARVSTIACITKMNRAAVVGSPCFTPIIFLTLPFSVPTEIFILVSSYSLRMTKIID